MKDNFSVASRFGLFKGILPIQGKQTLKDAVAGFQLAAMNIPQALGYTKIAGTPVVTGFYTLLLPLLAFAALGSSRYLVVAADSATAAILAGGLSPLAPIASPHYMALASMVALLTAILLLLARVLKLGFLADFLSQTVLVGFLTGVGFQVGIAVLGEMLGLQIQSRRTVVQLIEVIRDLPQSHLLTATLSIIVVVVVFFSAGFAPKLPGPLVAVVAAIWASEMWGFEGRGVDIVGPVAGGLPHIGLPEVHGHEILSVIGLSFSCFVMIVAQSAATARFYAARHQQQSDEDRDLVGLSAANATAALSGTFVVNGSPTQTAMVESSGGTSQLAQVSTAIVVAVVLLFLTQPLQYLPRCVLGSIVFFIAVRLIDIRGLKDIKRESHGEFVLAVITAGIVVLVGVEQGILTAMVLSLLRVVKHSYRPHTGVLVADERETWRLTPVVEGSITEPGLTIYRFGASLFYANAGRFSQEARLIAGPSPSKIRWLVVDAEATTNVDYTAARMLRQLQPYLLRQGVRLVFARVDASLQADLVRHRLLDVIGSQFLFPRLHEAVAAFAREEESAERAAHQGQSPGQT
ncbi:MAG TPA: SulP family inorganic anion transporter, partial [Terriglobales bacterium]